MAERQLNDLAEWLDQRTGQSPAVLAARTRAYALVASPQASVAETLAGAARGALAEALAQPGDRSVALDLLAGDALMTLALLAQAETAPAELGRFAWALMHGKSPTP